MLKKLSSVFVLALSLLLITSSARAVTWQECVSQGPENFELEELEQCHQILRWFLAIGKNQIDTCQQQLDQCQQQVNSQTQTVLGTTGQYQILSPSTTTQIQPSTTTTNVTSPLNIRESTYVQPPSY